MEAHSCSEMKAWNKAQDEEKRNKGGKEQRKKE
jgi:hypothetical protein